MNADRWQQLQKLFHQAMEHPPAERKAFLLRAEADQDLVLEALSLLDAHDHAPDLLPSVVRAPPAIGRRVGAYRLVRELGRGGMGTVYLGVRDDAEFKRDVAVKLINREIDSAFAVARFRAERQILANLDHPHIAHLLDGGTTEDGVIYLVMELVEGEPIDVYCKRRGLDVEARLRLFLTICEAVEHAHQRGVIHRDLKPGNIMITPDGQVKLLDFGIAKIMTPDSFGAMAAKTATGMLMATPQYASLEQLRGEAVSVTSDVYSLGVVLFELLTGTLPYSNLSGLPHEMARMIAETAPGAPSAASMAEGNPLWRRLRGDLDTIVLTALKKEPSRRYQTAAELADDIRRHLNGVAIRARRDGLVYRAGKILRRHRSMASGAAIAGVILGAWIILEPARHPAGAVPASSTVPQPRAVAVLPFRTLGPAGSSEMYLGSGMADAVITKLGKSGQLVVRPTNAILRYARSGQDPLAAGREQKVESVVVGTIQQNGGRLRVGVELLDVASGRMLWGETIEQPAANLFALEDSIAESVSQHLLVRMSAAQHTQMARQGTTNAAAHEAYLKGRFYASQRTAGTLPKAIQYYENAIRIDPRYALAYAGFGEALELAAFYGAGQTDLVRAQSMAERAMQLDPTLAEPHVTIAVVLTNRWKWREAEEEFQRAIRLDPNLTSAHHRFALFLAGCGRMDEAIRQIRLAQELDPMAPVLNTLEGIILTFSRRYDDAIALGKSYSQQNPNWYGTYYYMCNAYAMKGDLQNAILMGKKAQQLVPGEHISATYLAAALARNGQKKEAEVLVDRFRQESEHGSFQPGLIAVPLAALGKTDEAFRWLGRAADSFDPMLPALLTVEPGLDPLRSDPRYGALLRRTGLDAQASRRERQ